jgi:hypothetical protein
MSETRRLRQSLNKAMRTSGRLLHHIEQAQWRLPSGADTAVPPKPPNPSLLPLVADLCRAYDAQLVYVAYSLLSGQIHPSAQGAMAYVDDVTGLHSEPRLEAHGSIIHTAVCLIQATKTINRLITGEPLSEAIKQAEHALGVTIDLWPLGPEHGPRQPLS